MSKRIHASYWIIASFLVLLSCRSDEVKDDSINADSKTLVPTTVSTGNQGFIDSISNRMELSMQQVKVHLNIENLTIGKGSTFAGDTVYRFNEKYLVAILVHDNHLVCSNKIGFVLDIASSKNSDSKLLQQYCDEDESVSFNKRSVSILKNGNLQIDDYFINRDTNKKTPRDSVSTITWTIDAAGRFKEVKN